MMETDELVGIMIFIFIVICLIAMVGISVLVDHIHSKRDEKLHNLKSTRGQEMKELTKKEAIYLIKKCSENPGNDLPLLDRGDHYFVYRSSHEGWLETSAKIPNCSLMVARTFNVKEELQNTKLNTSSRILIFNEYGDKSKKYYIMRHVWAIGSLDKEKEFLASVYEREDFKRFYETHEMQLKEIWNLTGDFLRQAEIFKALSDIPIAYLSVIRTSGLTDRTDQHKMSFKIYDAIDCYQVVTKIPGILH